MNSVSSPTQKSSTGVAAKLANLTGIRPNYRDPAADQATRGESGYSISSADTYVEEEPTAAEWIRHVTPTGAGLGRWAYSLFPFVHWITRYNLQWLYGDLVAGKFCCKLHCSFSSNSPNYRNHRRLRRCSSVNGLRKACRARCSIRSLFLLHGCLDLLVFRYFQGHHYWRQYLRSHSPAIPLLNYNQPVAVMSLIVGNVVLKVKKTDPKIPGHVVASALAIVCGSIITFIGLIRMGWIVDFISLAAISAFMTGSAINIAVGQFPNLMGITGFDTRAATYKVVINSLKHLRGSKLDAAMGLTALLMLYLIRSTCNIFAKKIPSRAKFFFFLSTLRTAFVILLYTLISYLVNRHHRATKNNRFKITGPVPRGKETAPMIR